MKRLVFILLLCCNACSLSEQQAALPLMKKCTPILTVDAIEPCLPFWVDQLGFTKTMEAPEGDRLGFAGLAMGPVEVMLQTRSSIIADMPALEPHLPDATQFLFIEVEDLDAIKARLKEGDIYMPERETFYGTREIGAREPGGHYLTFAERIEPAGEEAAGDSRPGS
ncbi:MAG: VOC family protein [Planctomycetota bacterium]|jgi:uncharacterized glyoxalase superfamily protein PhnB